MASLRDLFVRLGIKTNPQDVNKANQSLESIKKTARAAIAAVAGFASVRFIKGIADETRELGDRLDKVSQQIGVSTDALQELEFAGGLAGAATGDVSTALRILSRNAREAAEGSEEYASDFRAMGITVTDTNGRLKSADQLLMDVADGMGRLSTDTERTALAQTLLGRSGTKLIPLLKQGSSAIAAQRQEAQELGLLNKDQIAQAVALTDNQLRLSRAWSSVKFIVAGQLLPAMNRLTKTLTSFLRVNKDIIKAKVEAFFRRTGQLVKGVSDFTRRLIDITGSWVDSLGPVGQQILKITGIVLALVAVMMLPGVPILLLIALIALLIEDFETWRKGGESVIGDIVGWFEGLAQTVMSYADTVRDSIAGFFEWVDNHKEGITLVASLISGLAITIAAQMAWAHRSAILSALQFRLWSVKYYAVIWAQSALAAAKSAAAWVASAAASAAAWVVAAAPLILTTALVGILIGTLIWLGVQFYKLLTGQENFFTTMAEGIADLIDRFDGIGPAIWEMLKEALTFWVEFFVGSRKQAEEWVGNLQTTLTHLWDNVLEFWSKKLGGWWDRWSKFIDFGFGVGGGEPARPGAGGATSPAPGIVAPPRIAPTASVSRSSTVVDNSTRNVTMSVVTQPGQSNAQIADEVVRRMRSEEAGKLRAAQQSFAVGAP